MPSVEFNQILQNNLTGKVRQDKFGAQEKIKENLKKAVDKVTPQKEGIEHQP